MAICAPHQPLRRPPLRAWQTRRSPYTSGRRFASDYNLGIRGETSRALRTRWGAEAAFRLDGHDGRVVFSFRTNDMVLHEGQTRVPWQETLENARSILSEASACYPTIDDRPARHPLANTDICLREAAQGDGSHRAAQRYAAYAELVLAWPA